MLNSRPKIIVYVSCINKLGSCMYRYTRYTIHDVFVYRVPNSELQTFVKNNFVLIVMSI